jgi:hypothetical protein
MDQAPGKLLSEDREVRRKMIAILRILSETEEPLGARAIGRDLGTMGIELSERQVRYHLQFMDERGLTQAVGNAGRVLTDQGRKELDSALVTEKVGFVAARIERLAYQTTFDLETGEGEVILNVSLVPEGQLDDALDIARQVMAAELCMSDLVIVDEEGDELGVNVHDDMVAVGTICSVTLNGTLLHQYIPIRSIYGGLLQIHSGRPLRFVELVSYEGTSIDPLHIFIASGLTSSWEAAQEGNGMVGAGFRELPAPAVSEALEVIDAMKEYRLGGVLAVGAPGQPLLDIPVALDRVGLIVIGGLTPMAAASEQGVDVDHHAMSATCEYSHLTPIGEL